MRKFKFKRIIIFAIVGALIVLVIKKLKSKKEKPINDPELITQDEFVGEVEFR